MSSFFTLPASQKKRKRVQSSDANGAERKSSTRGRRREDRDESISGSEGSSDEEDTQRRRQGGLDSDEDDEDDEEEFGDEDPAAKRVRLAEQYLANTQKEVLDDAGFDAADVDAENLRRRMGERLKEDTAESRGKLYRWIAGDLDWKRAEVKSARIDGKSVTAVAVQGKFVYTAGKDRAVSKWEMPSGQPPMKDGKVVGRAGKKPRRVAYSAGSRREKKSRDYQQHTGPILCIAASQDGKFVATGGADNKMVVWDAATLKPLKAFSQHRDSVTSLAFRRGSNQLFSASRDRTVKIWSLDELAYIETLFGHQDEVVDVSALNEEKCLTVGARDRTARLWKVVEESQLVFRGGGAPPQPKRNPKDSSSTTDHDHAPIPISSHHEGSMDRITSIDDDTFLTASDNGSLALWNIHKKKPVFVYPLAHGLEPALPLELLSAEANPAEQGIPEGEPQPRWITALKAVPFSDLVVSGSWDGVVRVWKVSGDKRRIEALGAVGGGDGLEVASVGNEAVMSALLDAAGDGEGKEDGGAAGVLASSALMEDVVQEVMRGGAPSALTTAATGTAHGVINDLAIVDRGERGKSGVLIAAVVGSEHRLGRWSSMEEVKSRLVLFEVPKKVAGDDDEEAGEEESTKQLNGVGHNNGEDFAGFD
ncbi:WD40 repeat-like protein [Hortaea werneckii]|nr:WD40 repeat-like protein [Hortaea werneckii]KAI6993654.1 WD40 repeat-like protein [Hortaea werneckii]KAI7145600.1 WD40 repeat-like protein [Hortaea werneckii]KAI7174339.1 WD40 repeat-like protein [Hortaea werneckii]KAI7506749.1 WD40 repeat-like protein [Hortaea werneckii]